MIQHVIISFSSITQIIRNLLMLFIHPISDRIRTSLLRSFIFVLMLRMVQMNMHDMNYKEYSRIKQSKELLHSILSCDVSFDSLLKEEIL